MEVEDIGRFNVFKQTKHWSLKNGLPNSSYINIENVEKQYSYTQLNFNLKNISIRGKIDRLKQGVFT